MVVSGRKGFLEEGGRGYIRFEGKCSRASGALGRLRTFPPHSDPLGQSLIHETPAQINLFYKVHKGRLGIYTDNSSRVKWEQFPTYGLISACYLSGARPGIRYTTGYQGRSVSAPTRPTTTEDSPKYANTDAIYCQAEGGSVQSSADLWVVARQLKHSRGSVSKERDSQTLDGPSKRIGRGE